jgi:hypothetical protein
LTSASLEFIPPVAIVPVFPLNKNRRRLGGPPAGLDAVEVSRESAAPTRNRTSTAQLAPPISPHCFSTCQLRTQVSYRKDRARLPNLAHMRKDMKTPLIIKFVGVTLWRVIRYTQFPQTLHTALVRIRKCSFCGVCSVHPCVCNRWQPPNRPVRTYNVNIA